MRGHLSPPWWRGLPRRPSEQARATVKTAVAAHCPVLRNVEELTRARASTQLPRVDKRGSRPAAAPARFDTRAGEIGKLPTGGASLKVRPDLPRGSIIHAIG